MASVQDRLSLKRSYDNWSTREQLCLASSVLKSGDQNWMSVSKTMKAFVEKENPRPPDWFSQKSCAIQYAHLLENADTPKRKKRESGETTGESIVGRLTRERIAELGQILAQQRDDYRRLKAEMNIVVAGSVTEAKLREMWMTIEQELDGDRELEQKSKTHTAWLVKRQQKQELNSLPQGVSNINQRKPTEIIMETLETAEVTDEDEKKNRGGRSPLLTSLLKSPSPTMQIQASATTAQASSPTITSLLGSSPKVPNSQLTQNVSSQLHRIVDPVISNTPPSVEPRPSVGAPTLSMLLEMPANTQRGPLPNLQAATTIVSQQNLQTAAHTTRQPQPVQPVTIQNDAPASTQSLLLCAASIPVNKSMVQIIDNIDDVIRKDIMSDVMDKDEINEIIGDLEEIIKEEITGSPPALDTAATTINALTLPHIHQVPMVTERPEPRDVDEVASLSNSPESEMAIEEIDSSTSNIAEIIGTVAIEPQEPKIIVAEITESITNLSEEVKSEESTCDDRVLLYDQLVPQLDARNGENGKDAPLEQKPVGDEFDTMDSTLKAKVEGNNSKMPTKPLVYNDDDDDEDDDDKDDKDSGGDDDNNNNDDDDEEDEDDDEDDDDDDDDNDDDNDDDDDDDDDDDVDDDDDGGGGSGVGIGGGGGGGDDDDNDNDDDDDDDHDDDDEDDNNHLRDSDHDRDRDHVANEEMGEEGEGGGGGGEEAEEEEEEEEEEAEEEEEEDDVEEQHEADGAEEEEIEAIVPEAKVDSPSNQSQRECLVQLENKDNQVLDQLEMHLAKITGEQQPLPMAEVVSDSFKVSDTNLPSTEDTEKSQDISLILEDDESTHSLDTKKQITEENMNENTIESTESQQGSFKEEPVIVIKEKAIIEVSRESMEKSQEEQTEETLEIYTDDKSKQEDTEDSSKDIVASCILQDIEIKEEEMDDTTIVQDPAESVSLEEEAKTCREKCMDSIKPETDVSIIKKREAALEEANKVEEEPKSRLEGNLVPEVKKDEIQLEKEDEEDKKDVANEPHTRKEIESVINATEDTVELDEEESSLSKLSGGRAMKTYSKKQNASIDSEPENEGTGEGADYRAWKKAVMLVYNRLATHKYASVFLRPITEDQAPGYHSVIFRPMDLLTIKKNIDNGTIRSTMHFQRDVMLMFQNAIMYNKHDTFIYKMAVSMQEECLQHMQILVQVTGEGTLGRETRTAASSSHRETSDGGVKRKRSHITPSPHDTDGPRSRKRRKSEND